MQTTTDQPQNTEIQTLLSDVQGGWAEIKKLPSAIKTLEEENSRLTQDLTDVRRSLLTRHSPPAPRLSGRVSDDCARQLSATYEFGAADTEVSPPCFPIESVTKFELKSNEADGWSEQTGVQYLIRRQCVISLTSPLSTINSPPSTPLLARVTLTGGYVLPGDTPAAGQTALPDDLEQAAVEQVAYWFRNRDKTGLVRSWPNGGTYEVFAHLDLLLEVRAVLKKYERFQL